MSTKSRNTKPKPRRRLAMKKRSANITKKDGNVSQSLKYAQKASSKDGEDLNYHKTEDDNFNEYLPKLKRNPPKYFDDIDNDRKQSIEILRNISISYSEFLKLNLINSRELSYSIIYEIYNSMSKQYLIPETYFAVYNNMNRKYFQNMYRINSIIRDLTVANLNSLTTSISLYQKYFYMLNHD